MNIPVSLHGFLFIVLNTLILFGLVMTFAMAFFALIELGDKIHEYIKHIRDDVS